MFYVILAILAPLAWYCSRKAADYSASDWWILATILTASPLAGSVIAIPIMHITHTDAIHQFHSVQNSLESARERGDDLERAAIQQTVFESNKWLASAQYWNSTIIDPMIPDAVEELEPIR